jgi:hypothetical protein
VVLRLGKVEGLKKLNKLLFLVQYEKALLGRAVREYVWKGEPVVGEFFLWEGGPVLDPTELEGLTVDGAAIPATVLPPPGVSLQDLSGVLPLPVRRRVDKVLQKYGEKRGWELEERALKVLGIRSRAHLEEVKGQTVDEFLRKEGRLARWDLCPSPRDYPSSAHL